MELTKTKKEFFRNRLKRKLLRSSLKKLIKQLLKLQNEIWKFQRRRKTRHACFKKPNINGVGGVTMNGG